MSLFLEPFSDAQLVFGGSEETGLFSGMLVALQRVSLALSTKLGTAQLTS